MTTKCAAVAILFAGLLTGCAVMGTMKMAFSTYEEPADGPRARLRLINDQPSPFIYPARECVRNGAKGSGVAPGSRPDLMNSLEARRIGMPSAPVPGGRSVAEMYVRAGEPITFSLSAGGCGKNLCPIDDQQRSICSQARSFVPKENVDYVATILKQGDTCDIHLFRIEPKGKRHVVVPEPSEIASPCAEDVAALRP